MNNDYRLPGCFNFFYCYSSSNIFWCFHNVFYFIQWCHKAFPRYSYTSGPVVIIYIILCLLLCIMSLGDSLVYFSVCSTLPCCSTFYNVSTHYRLCWCFGYYRKSTVYRAKWLWFHNSKWLYMQTYIMYIAGQTDRRH